MSKDKMKNLLNENTIRRFMKLAEIETLSDQFVENISERYGEPVDPVGAEELEEMGPSYDRDDEDDVAS